MKKVFTGTLALLSLAVGSLTNTPSAYSGPNPDRSGVCYFFRGDTRELTQTCVIGTGHGAGMHYARLLWDDGVETSIHMIWINSGRDTRYTVDDVDAEVYERDVFFNETTTQSDNNMPCYRVIETGNSVCYRFN